MGDIKRVGVKIPRGIFGFQSGTNRNVIISKNGTIRLKVVNNNNRRSKND